MYKLLTENQFLEEFINATQYAHRRVWVQAMIIEASDVVDRFTQALKNNPHLEKLDIQIQYDWITTRSIHGDTPLIPIWKNQSREYAKQLHLKNYLALKELRNINATTTMLNTPKLLPKIFPITGRNHTKIYIIDDKAWIGGCNFMDSSFDHVDFMISPNFPELVHILQDHFKKVNKNRPKENTQVALQNGDYFLADNGTHGNSLIYKQAQSLIENANHEIIFMSQFTPTGAILDSIINRINNGVTAHIITCPADHDHFTKLPHTIPHSIFEHKIKNVQNIHVHHTQKPVHAKIIITDKQQLIIGSHNYVDTGVYLGTEEIALKSINIELVNKLYQQIIRYTK